MAGLFAGRSGEARLWVPKYEMSEEEMMAVPDTVSSSLWLSLVDMLVVFAVLAFLMVICYALKFFSRGSLVEVSVEDTDQGQVDVAAGDEPASELPMMGSAPSSVESSGRLAPAMVAPAHVGTTRAVAAGGLGTQTGLSRGFKITVNGRAFDVRVEQMTGMDPASPAPAIPVPAAQGSVVAPAVPAAAFRSAPSHRSAGTSNLMKSPLPGKILKVFAAPGKAFKRGDTLLVIEAMKMENEILAPRDCVVGEVHVEVNQSVKTGEPLLRME